MHPKTRVVFIGAGKIGQAIAHLIRQTPNVQLTFWDVDVSKVPGQKPLEEILPSADLVWFCVPSWFLRSAITTCKPFLSKKSIVLSVSKGLQEDSGFTTDQLIRSLLPGQPFALFLGPMLADEILRGSGAFATIASTSPEARKKVATLFKKTDLQTDEWAKPHDAALAGIFKNMYTIPIGIADSLGWGFNQKGVLITRARNEMREAMQVLHGDPKIFDRFAGEPDFFATSASPNSTNRRLGEEFGKLGKTSLKSEGSVSLRPLLALLKGKMHRFPILQTMEQVFIKSADPKKAFTKLQQQLVNPKK